MVKQSCPPGWTVTKDRGDRMRLQRRGKGISESLSLPFSWTEADAADALLYIRTIAKAFVKGSTSLKGAAAMGDAVSSERKLSWQDAFEMYRRHRANTSDATWKKNFVPWFRAAEKALASRKAPTTGKQLCDAALQQWDPGTRQRQIMRQGISGFLNYCVDELQFNSCWIPPKKVQGEAVTSKRVGYPMTDEQVLRVIDCFGTTNSQKRWQFAFKLMAVYGLRPADLCFIKTKRNGTELWSDYRKSKGGQTGEKTEPRRLYPLLIHGADGKPIDWKLREEVHRHQKAGTLHSELLPPIKGHNDAGKRAGETVRFKQVWKEISAEAASEGEELVVYSCRHRYAYVAHNRPTKDGRMRAPKQIADAMGHSLEVHLKSYARFQSKDLESVFD